MWRVLLLGLPCIQLRRTKQTAPEALIVASSSFNRMSKRPRFRHTSCSELLHFFSPRSHIKFRKQVTEHHVLRIRVICKRGARVIPRSWILLKSSAERFRSLKNWRILFSCLKNQDTSRAMQAFNFNFTYLRQRACDPRSKQVTGVLRDLLHANCAQRIYSAGDGTCCRYLIDGSRPPSARRSAKRSTKDPKAYGHKCNQKRSARTCT